MANTPNKFIRGCWVLEKSVAQRLNPSNLLFGWSALSKWLSYLVTSSAHLLAGVRTHINDRVWDRKPTVHKFLGADAHVKFGLALRPALTVATWNSVGKIAPATLPTHPLLGKVFQQNCWGFLFWEWRSNEIEKAVVRAQYQPPTFITCRSK